MHEELAALEALRDSSAELVTYLNQINEKLTKLNDQNELSLSVLDNWASVFAVTRTCQAHAQSQRQEQEDDEASDANSPPAAADADADAANNNEAME